MHIKELSIEGLFEIYAIENSDSRGSFINIFRDNNLLFREAWGNRKIRQVNISNNIKVGSIRGLHFQSNPYMDAKIVRCLSGKIWDVAIDLRVNSLTYCQWVATTLSPEKLNALFIPEGFAHGFQVLEPNSQVLYLHSQDWVPEFEKGYRWNDFKFKINWPLPLTEISMKDQLLPYF
ncbi:dTDP-4-dehydrorhamnose 3,5-epimerase family protein [Prochlorococcus sp. MIT 0801]|uniref:dTDP-4-dehydrorhamnose 3,5-epimerase family protein n=1 Tax=Prochlorococcus sp. MIT 0801 TaxID=1501269 RepID=UPI0004F5DF14|nr:dTDP-4-dehydrorhamnose 3,5-epimerase family protein [Prochlorococcus sp. MIT 0801]AIQ98272.1 dTDP-4-dehydrorhamnose 3,5-epimerase [Prochlorococcus sp. MIT 0801]